LCFCALFPSASAIALFQTYSLRSCAQLQFYLYFNKIVVVASMIRFYAVFGEMKLEQRESVQNLGCAAEPSHSWRATYMPQSSAF
ncbi:hypothetical protein LIR37_17285, partial [Flavonifractor plautii]|uniref:hypothetical protein n=1 Tax=Flavonifractor plautii TaxID=292800 RepID=UPI001D00218F